MKKVFIILVPAILLLAGFYFFIKNNSEKNRYKNFEKTNYELQSPSTSLRTNYRLLVADTPEKWERGLMFFRKLEGVDGMIFIFPDKQYRTFWNKNTLMDLELLWLDGDKVVGKSYLPSIEKSKEIVNVESPKPADKVIELPTGN